MSSNRQAVVRSRSSVVDWVIVGGLFASGIVLRLLMLGSSHFDGLYGQDAYAYYDFGQELIHALSEGRTPGHFFWPLGYPAVLAGTFSLLGSAAEIGQSINILLGTLLAALVYILARHYGMRRSTAAVSGLVMLVCGQAVQSSIVVMSDIPALFWATLSAVVLVGWLDRDNEHKRSFGLSAAFVLLALAGITRWIYLILFVPWFLGAVATRHKIRWRYMLLALGAAGIVFLPQILYSRTNPAPTLNHAFVDSWSPANALMTSFTTVEGHFEYQRTNAVHYAQPFYEPYYLSPIFSPLFIIGILALVWRKLGLSHRETEGAEKKQVTIIMLSWAILPYLFLAGIPYQNIRFPLIVFPAVAVLVGVGLEWILTRFEAIKITSRLRWALSIGFVGLLTVGLGQTLFTAHGTIEQFIANQQRDKAVAAWAGENVPGGAAVYTFGLTLTLQHYTTLDARELYYETVNTLAAKWEHGRDDYLLINVWNIENQWKDREPQTAFHWLRDVRGLTELGRMGNYTLYRVGG